MMKSRRICPADGSQYRDSAVGLVFMESAAGLAMETSKVESAVRNQATAKLNQLEHIEADVNAGQHHCSARRKRRRLASAKEPVDAHIRFPNVNDGQLYCSSRLVSCSLQLVLRESYRPDLMTLLFSFLGTFVVDSRASGNTALSSPCWDRYPPCVEWLTTTVHGRGNGRLSCLMHIVFGCGVTASGSLPHCEHTPWPLLLQILGAVLEFLSPLDGRAFCCYPVSHA
ncbi:hypothetical protein F511_41314 [Dorcoceras hygrometricum]|uniref:Uncharacterized protein n=1 Tax=Dorcoceras hygrometricum TaxID=472368 RepID=A0A2Z7BVE9_9LAMI|nr:hypothetical protein F511_41314 [Dorcoceras hygrometricum]